jgi:protein-tyrosine phosphatase
VIDLHSHILPGIDDGATTVLDSLRIALASVRAGVQVMAATPHVRDDYPTRPETMERLVEEVRTALADAEIPLDVRPGGELALDWVERLSTDELRRFGLGGNPSYLLVEFPYYAWPLTLGQLAIQLRSRGITPVLGHPERNPEVQSGPERLRPLVEAGALVQLTAASVDGRLGRGPAQAARSLIQGGLAHMIASDAHSAEVRAAGLAEAAGAVHDDALARWLTVDVPGAVVAGTPIPPRPESGRRGLFA